MNHADELIAAEEELEISPYEDESDCYEQERTSLYR
jgi:hypothetical protein